MDIKLTVTLDEANLIVASLGKQPFEMVADLVNKLREQAIPQVQAAQPSENVTGE